MIVFITTDHGDDHWSLLVTRNAQCGWATGSLIFITDHGGQWSLWVLNVDGSQGQTLLLLTMATNGHFECSMWMDHKIVHFHYWPWWPMVTLNAHCGWTTGSHIFITDPGGKWMLTVDGPQWHTLSCTVLKSITTNPQNIEMCISAVTRKCVTHIGQKLLNHAITSFGENKCFDLNTSIYWCTHINRHTNLYIKHPVTQDW